MKNQFRSLDEDEIEFLDSVLESTRAEEERVKRETREGLEAFRRQQEEADKKAREAEGEPGAEGRVPAVDGEQWAVGGRKRKKKTEKEVLKGVKIRRVSSTVEELKAASPATPSATKLEGEHAQPAKPIQEKQTESNPEPSPKPTELVAQPKPPALPSKSRPSLVSYGSDEDDDW